MYSWFPILDDLIDDPKFSELSPATRAVFFALLSEFNDRGKEFYIADFDLSAKVGVSIRTIEEARKALNTVGLIQCIPGRIVKGKHLATTYTSVLHSNIKERSQGTGFSKFDRFALEYYFHLARNGLCSHRQLVLYMYLWHFAAHHRAKGQDSFAISKRYLRDVTGWDNAFEQLKKLSDTATFSNGDRLFVIEERGGKVRVSDFGEFADPSTDDHNHKLLGVYQDAVKHIAEQMRSAGLGTSALVDKSIEESAPAPHKAIPVGDSALEDVETKNTNVGPPRQTGRTVSADKDAEPTHSLDDIPKTKAERRALLDALLDSKTTGSPTSSNSSQAPRIGKRPIQREKVPQPTTSPDEPIDRFRLTRIDLYPKESLTYWLPRINRNLKFNVQFSIILSRIVSYADFDAIDYMERAMKPEHLLECIYLASLEAKNEHIDDEIEFFKRIAKILSIAGNQLKYPLNWLQEHVSKEQGTETE